MTLIRNKLDPIRIAMLVKTLSSPDSDIFFVTQIFSHGIRCHKEDPGLSQSKKDTRSSYSTLKCYC